MRWFSLHIWLNAHEQTELDLPQFGGQGTKRNYADGSTVAHRPEVKGSTPAMCVWTGAEGYGR